MSELMKQAEKFDEILDEIGEVRSNPSNEENVEDASAFLEFLEINGKLKTYTPADWKEVGLSFGLTNEELHSWMENAAGWIVDTTNAIGDVEPAGWSPEQLKFPRRLDEE